MYRHSPVRNQRSKGIRIKHVLQVCLLIAVCFWLLFQVKRSHDKRKEFDTNDPKVSLSTRAQGSDEIVKFGRKDLHPKLEETTVHEETQEHEQEEEDEQEEHEENKQEDEEQDEDKIEEEKDDGGGGGDDEIDENEQEKSDVEIDREEVDIIDEERENEESDGKENEGKDDQGENQTQNEVSVDDHDEDGSTSTSHTHEAREEQYKADDASSAVTHDARNLGAENESKNGTLVDHGETTENVTIIQEKDSESINGTSITDSQVDGPPSNTTLMTPESTQVQNLTVSVGYRLDSNARESEITQGSSNLTETSEILKSDESTAEDNSSDPSKTENLDTNDVTEGTEESIDSTDTAHLEEKEVRIDLDTLPETETEGGNSEDTAAE